MPLKEGVSNATRQENIKEMIAAGHEPDQAVAASYEQQRRSRKKRPGRPASDAAPTTFTLCDSVILDDMHRSEHGYLAAYARCARVGTQRYKGYEVGLPDREHVVLYRPAEEVFSRDAMHSMAHRPVTLTHPPVMVNSKNWTRYAKGQTGDEVVRDGEFVKVPVTLMDQATIDAVESGDARELSMGYTTDISWVAGKTPDGQPYDGVQRQIRANHLAVVPVARGGSNLTFGDASSVTCPNCGNATQPNAMTCPSCGFDLKPTPRSGEDITANDGDNEEEGIMPVIKMFDGIPIQFADEVSAAAMEREFRKLQLQVADAGDFGGKKKPPFSGKAKKEDGTGSDDDSGDANGHQDATGDGASDTEARRRKVTAEDALKQAQGEIAVLRKQIADAGSLDAKAEALAEQRVALLDAAKALLPQGFKPEGKSLSDIRRAAVSTQFTDAETKGWDDGQYIGAFAAMTKAPPKTGARNMADGMSAGMRANVGMVRGTNLADAEAEAAKAHAEMVTGLQNAYKNPLTVVRN